MYYSCLYVIKLNFGVNLFQSCIGSNKYIIQTNAFILNVFIPVCYICIYCILNIQGPVVGKYIEIKKITNMII